MLTMYFASPSESGIAFEAILNALPSVDSFFLMGGTLTAYIVFRELEKAGSSSPRSVGKTFASEMTFNFQALGHHNLVLRPSLPSPHDPVCADHGSRHCCPTPPRLRATVVTVCQLCRGFLTLSSLVKTNSISQEMPDDGMAKLALREWAD